MMQVLLLLHSRRVAHLKKLKSQIQAHVHIHTGNCCVVRPGCQVLGAAAGEAPPITASDWDREFAKYRASPEFRRVNSRMTLPEFKFIYWMEYAHRMWGRALGLVFAVPALAFAARGHIRGPLAGRLGLLFLMGGAQVRRPRMHAPVTAHMHARMKHIHN